MALRLTLAATPARRPSRLVGLGTLAALAAGCVTTGEGEAMRAETAQLKARLDAMDQRDAEAKEQLARLRKVLDEATSLLTRNSADLGAKVGKIEADLQVLSGRIDEVGHALEVAAQRAGEDRARSEARLATLEQSQQKVVATVAPPVPEDKEQLWAAAGQRMAGGQNEEARKLFRVFLQRFPQDPRAPQSLLVVGQSLLAERRLPQAAGEFQKVLDAYPKAPEVPEAMWQLALAFQELKFCGDARALLLDLPKRFPKSPHADEAKNRAKDVEKLLKDKARCTS